jgi:CHAT domain-containing protein/tetratricopeptide (TPR) repeat protein
MGVKGKIRGRSPAWCNPACALGVLFWWPFWQSMAQAPQGPTFQLQEAKTPAESVDSIKLLERALELTQTALGPDDRAVGELAYRLAQRYDEAGDYDRALLLYRRSLAIKEKELGPEDPGVADCLNDIGLLQKDLGNYGPALELLQRSLRITQKAYGRDHAEVATTLSNISDTYADKGDYSAALPFARQALQIREKTLGRDHPDVADSLDSLADVYRGLGDADQALRLAERALKIAERAVGPDDALTAGCLSTLADVQKDRGKLVEAARFYRRALTINQRIMGPEHPEIFRNLCSLAQISVLSGDLQEAISTLGDLGTRQRSYLARHFQTSSWKVASRVADVFRESSEILQSLCAATTVHGTNSIVAEAAHNLALNKGFWEEVQAAHAAVEANQETAVAELHEKYRNVQSELAHLPDTEPDTDKRDAKRRELESQLSKITTELAHRVGVAAERILQEKTSLVDIASNLPKGAALVDFVDYRRFDFAAKTNQWKERHYAAYLTFPLERGCTNLTVVRVDLGEARLIDGTVQIICQRLAAGQYSAQDVSQTLHRLSELVYGPLRKHLVDYSHLIICPDGQLSRLPFEMLLSSPSTNWVSTARGPSLVEEKIVSYVGSGHEIARFNSSKDSSNGVATPVGRNSFVFGNPDFDLDLGNVHPTSATTQLSGASTGGRLLSRDYHGLKFQALPGAEAEAQSIAKLLGDGTILKLGRDAREAELKATVSPRVLLLATHGFFLSDQDLAVTNNPVGEFLARGIQRSSEDSENPLMRCGVALAGANHAFTSTNSVAEDGLLTGLEASMLKLQGTELVILSACDSGDGEIKIGEGVMSLQRAFRIAGAQTVLASHWNVSDRATDELMTKFIEVWRSGKPRAQAWREAQLALAHSKDFSNPYFWAAFTLTGQWK